MKPEWRKMFLKNLVEVHTSSASFQLRQQDEPLEKASLASLEAKSADDGTSSPGFRLKKLLGFNMLKTMMLVIHMLVFAQTSIGASESHSFKCSTGMSGKSSALERCVTPKEAKTTCTQPIPSVQFTVKSMEGTHDVFIDDRRVTLYPFG